MNQELEVYTGAPPSTLYGTDDPHEIVRKATIQAEALAEVVEKRKLYSMIGPKNRPDQQKKHVRVEGWTFLGTMLGVYPVTVWSRPVAGGWEARVEARTRNGDVVGAAEAQCLDSEPNWGNRDDYALRSMAQTRATSKALRQPLGFVVTLAGFESTPAEEAIAESWPTERRTTASIRVEHTDIGCPECGEPLDRYVRPDGGTAYAHDLPDGDRHKFPASAIDPNKKG